MASKAQQQRQDAALKAQQADMPARPKGAAVDFDEQERQMAARADKVRATAEDKLGVAATLADVYSDGTRMQATVRSAGGRARGARAARD